MANEKIKEKNFEKALSTAYSLFLEKGIERVTKVMIAEKSELSIKSIDRYFTEKADCVVHVADWAMERIGAPICAEFPENVFSEMNGAQLFEKYMIAIKKLFLSDSRIFALYNEYKLYIYRHYSDDEQKYSLLINQIGNRRLRQRIYNIGKKDGSLPRSNDVLTEERYFCESFFGFLFHLSLTYSTYKKEEVEEKIDYRIRNTIELYTDRAVSII